MRRFIFECLRLVAKAVLLGAALIGAAILAFILTRSPHLAPSVPVVDLRTGGVVLLEGKAVSLAGLSHACTGSRVVALRVEDAVPWAHVEWVLMSLQAAGVRQVRFDLPDGPAEACFDSDYWKQDARHLPGGHFAGIVEVRSDDLGEKGLARRLADEAARIRRECRLKPLGEMFPDPLEPFGAVAVALRAFREAGIELEFAFDVWPDDAVPDVSLLTPPPDLPGMTNARWRRCECRPGIVVVDLPVADMGERDVGDEQDERLFIQLDRDGKVFCKEEERNLYDLAAFLRKAKERYDLKMRAKGKSGFEEFSGGGSVSKLYVLIRADPAAPAQQVGWILHVLAQEGFYKVQFAVRRGPETNPGPCVGGLDGKLTAFMAADSLPDIVSHHEPAIDVYVDPAAFGVGKARPRGLAEVANLVRAEHKVIGDDLHVAILHVAPGVTHERVVAAVNEIYRAGIEHVDFADLEPPDAATRLQSPLPR